MKAMILAAGLGKRMRPLTDSLPKPLLPVADKPLIQYHVENLARAGVRDIVVNLAYRGAQIREFLGDGSRWGVHIAYSAEPEPLETAGAILQAQALLGEEPFLLLNGDVWCDMALAPLLQHRLAQDCLGHLLLVPNPAHHPTGDFALQDGCLQLRTATAPGWTFSGISVLRPQLVTAYPERRRAFPLVECFRYAIARGQLSGEIYQGRWWDIGTPERLAELDRMLRLLRQPAG